MKCKFPCSTFGISMSYMTVNFPPEIPSVQIGHHRHNVLDIPFGHSTEFHIFFEGVTTCKVHSQSICIISKMSISLFSLCFQSETKSSILPRRSADNVIHCFKGHSMNAPLRHCQIQINPLIIWIINRFLIRSPIDCYVVAHIQFTKPENLNA